MTNIDKIRQRMEDLGISNKIAEVETAKPKAKAEKPTQEQERKQVLEQEEIVKECELEFGGKRYRKIDGIQDLEGVERLVRKYVKRWNAEPYNVVFLDLTEYDRQVKEQDVRLAILARPILDSHEKLPQGMQDFFGITTWRQYWDGYNIFKAEYKRKETTLKGVYDQDSFARQASPRDEIGEVILDQSLQTALGDYYRIFTMKYEMGMSSKAISKELGINKNTVTKRLQHALKIALIVLDVDEEGNPL